MILKEKGSWCWDYYGGKKDRRMSGYFIIPAVNHVLCISIVPSQSQVLRTHNRKNKLYSAMKQTFVKLSLAVRTTHWIQNLTSFVFLYLHQIVSNSFVLAVWFLTWQSCSVTDWSGEPWSTGSTSLSLFLHCASKSLFHFLKLGPLWTVTIGWLFNYPAPGWVKLGILIDLIA